MSAIHATLSQEENDFLGHISMFGSLAYPIRKLSTGRWIWTKFWGIEGTPKVYKTKRECSEAIELYLSILKDRAAGRL